MQFFYNPYLGLKNWSRYYITKYTPKFLRPFVLNLMFYRHYKHFLNLRHPKTFADKLNYLKLYEIIPKKGLLADKLEAKNYINKNLPSLKTTKVFQIADSFEELDFSRCPDTFVIKTNHACKTCILIEDKNKITKEQYEKLKKYYKKVLNMNFAYWGVFELQYKDIVRKIYTEEYIYNNDRSLLKEYEVYCFNGTPKFIECAYPCRPCATATWEETDFAMYWKNPETSFPFPSEKNKKAIIEYSKILAKDFIFARCDFMTAEDELYFGEVTFTPYMGNIEFDPPKYNLYWGEQLDISSFKK